MTDYTVTMIPTEHCQEMWGRVAKLLKPAVKSSRGRWTMANCLESLIDGRQNLWVAYDSNKVIKAAATTLITTYPNRKLLGIQFLGGTESKGWMDEAMPIFRRFARDNDCSGIEAIGRYGLWGILKHYGLSRSSIIYEEIFL